ncbi:unnamed protein product [Prunus armeniaca]|uniref:Uncharacterized protein n=1 Tax=Prunus armeniaca TaxID=36596 RepID=A0A6J5VNS5_PRUAR|nr:unnamed protein product [Prunus armeniaca]
MKLHSSDDDVVDGVVCILKAVIFKPNSSGSSLTDTREVDAMLPLLIHLLVCLITHLCVVRFKGQTFPVIMKIVLPYT